MPKVRWNQRKIYGKAAKLLTESKISDCPVFQTMRWLGSFRGKSLNHSVIPRLIKYYVRLTGLNTKDFAEHSLRAGLVTSATVNYVQLDKIVEISYLHVGMKVFHLPIRERI